MKILCSDYDGTFNYHGVDDRKREAVQRWRKAGNLFGFVTGRGIDTIAQIIRHDRVDCDFAVANNGAVIGRADGSVLTDRRCDSSVIGELVTEMFALGCPNACFSSSVRCVVHKNPPDKPSEEDHDLLWATENLPYFTQVSTVLPTEEKSRMVTAALTEKFSQWVNPLQNGICIDIVPAGVDKAEGIRTLASLMGISQQDVITVGDNINDTAMIAAFRSYAVKNAVPSILALADDVCADIVELIDREI
ncbi:MAG: HAD-IIB family hydrolase [Eubacteriales bacterium]